MEEEINNNENSTISKEAYGILALLLGALGVHDFAARRFLYGCGHLTLSIVAVAIFSVSQNSFLPPTLVFGSWVWAIVENLAYQKSGINTISQDKETKNEKETKGFLVFARTAEIITCLAILSGIITMVIIITVKSKNWVCSDTLCGWHQALAISIPMLVGIFNTILSIVFVSIVLMRKKELSAEQKCAKNILRHINSIGILSIILTIIIMIIVLTFLI